MQPDEPDQAGQRTFRVRKLKRLSRPGIFINLELQVNASERNGYGGELPVKYSDLRVDAREQGVS